MTFLYILLHIRKPNKAAKHDTQKAADHQAMQTIRPFGKITKYAIILDYEQQLEEETQKQRKRHIQRHLRSLRHFGGL